MTVADGGKTIGGATVGCPQVTASNGIIHPLTSVVLPAS